MLQERLMLRLQERRYASQGVEFCHELFREQRAKFANPRAIHRVPEDVGSRVERVEKGRIENLVTVIDKVPAFGESEIGDNINSHTAERVLRYDGLSSRR